MTTLAIGIWVLGGLLSLIGILIGVIYSAIQGKMNQMMTYQQMFLEEIVEDKKNIAKALSWLKAHDGRLNRIEDTIDK